jgi:hypothetical protein
MFSIVRSAAPTRMLAFCLLLLLAACGGGSGNSSTAPPPDPGSQSISLASNYTDIIEGGQLGQSHWPDGSGTGSPIDGVTCSNSAIYHIHAMVSIYRDGVRLAVPQSIGLAGCTYELHTHDATGVVHLETNAQKTLTFGQFFAVWGQPLGPSNVAGLTGTIRFYVIENEQVTPYTGNPADIQIAERRELAIVVGTPPASLARHRWPADM